MTATPDWDGALRRRNPRELRRLLSKPIRVNKIAPERRDAINREQTALRERALFALYHIPDDWPDLSRWEWLALHLAGELFSGCRTIEKGKGGPSIRRRRDIADRRMALFRQFETYFAAHSHLRRQRAAEEFVRKNRKACSEAGLSDGKSFPQAMKKISITTAP